MDETELLKRRIDRERRARTEAELLLDAKSRELYETNERLRGLNESLEQRVKDRMQQLSEANVRLQAEIEERNRTEAQLRLTQFTVDRAGDAIFWIDSTGRFVYANDAACRLLGYHREDVLTLRAYEVELGLTSDRWNEHWNQLRERPTTTLEARLINSSRDVFPAEVTASFIDFGGRRYLCQHVRDVSERKDNERRLRQARIRFETLINSLQGGVLVEDEARSIVLVNESFCRMFNIPIVPNLLVGFDTRTTCGELRAAFDAPLEFQKRIEQIIDKREVVASEQLRLLDGRILERDYVPIFFDRNYLGHLWHYRDITVAQRTHEILEQTLYDTAGRTGGEFFDSLTASLSRVLSVKWVDVFEIGRKGTRQLAAWPREDGNRLGLDAILARTEQTEPDDCLLAAPLRDSDGEILGWLSIHDDRPIRDRGLADTALQMCAERAGAELRRMRAEAENTQLAVVAARTDNAVVITDLLGRIEYVNEGFVRMTGYTREEVLGRTPGSFLQGPETDPVTIDYMRRQVRAGSGFRSEILNYAKSGRKYWVSIEAQPILDAEGRHTQYMAIESDITDRKRQEMRLQMQSEVLEQVATGLPLQEILDTLCKLVEMFVKHSSCTVLSVDDDARLLNLIAAPSFDPEEVKKGHSFELVPGHGSAVASVLENQPIYVADCHNDPHWALERDLAKKYNLAASWAHPIRAEQDVLGAFAITRTVAGAPGADQLVMLEIGSNLAGIAMKRHRDASALEKAVHRAESASRAKSEFLANMSHELRTPLTAITGYADLLSSAENRSDRDARWARQILRSAQHLGMLLDDLLDLSKVEAGRLTVEHRPCDLVAIVEEVSSLFRPRATEKLLGFSVQHGPGLPRRILSDPTRLRQILTNFVSNAIKFTSRGDVHVAVDLAKATTEEDKPELRISVTDSGVGMNSEQIALLFQPFQRVHRDTLQVGGTGLGLAISKRLAELMGGRIEIESTPEIGTKFTFVFPMEQAPESELEHSTLSAGLERPSGIAGAVDTGRNLQGLKVLVVDDNNDNVSIFTHLLEPLGVHVTVATNGQQAVDTVEAYLVAGNPFQVILMDMQMPILDGFQATALLRKRGVKTPVVALTAFAMPADQERCRQAGCDLFLAKPVRRQTLVATLVQAADLAARLSDTAALQAEVNASRPMVIERPNSISIHYGEQVIATDATPTPATALDTPLLTEKASPPPATEAFIRLLAQYRNSLRRYLKSIEEAEANGDTDEISRTTHRLKGTGTNYGFPKITEVAGACEDRLRSGGTMKDIQADLSVLKRLMREVIGD